MGPASVGAKGEPGTAVWGRRATGGVAEALAIRGGLVPGEVPPGRVGTTRCGVPGSVVSPPVHRAWSRRGWQRHSWGLAVGASKPVLGLGLMLSPRVSLLGPPEGFALGGE